MGEASSKTEDGATIASLRASLNSLEAARSETAGGFDESIKKLRDAIEAKKKATRNQKQENAHDNHASAKRTGLKDGSIATADSKPEPWAQWLKLLLIWCSSLACGGLTAGMNLFVPMFADSGLFAEACGGQPVPCKDQTLLVSNLFMVAASLTTLGFYPNGIAFDLIGGRGSGIVGNFLLALGAILVSAGLSTSASIPILIGLILMDLGNLFNASCFTALLWHLPDWQSLVLMLTFSTTPTAAFLPVVFRWAMSSFGFSIEVCLFVYAGSILAIAFVFLLVVPTQKQFFREAERVLGIPMKADKHTWKSFKTVVRASCSVVATKKVDIFLYCLANATLGITGVPWQMQLVAFGGTLFRDKQVGDELAVFQSLSSPVISTIAALVMGVYMDYFDLAATCYFLVVEVLILVVLGGVENYVVQQACVIVQCVAWLTQMVWGWRWVALWAPPHRYGMCFATISVSSVLTLAFGIGLWSVANALFEGISAFLIPLRIAGLSSAILWSILGRRLRKRPTMVLIGKDEEELMDQYFGLKTFDDAEEVLQKTRAEILRLVSSQDLKDRQLLIDAMESQEVQIRWVNLAHRKGYDLPEMSRGDYFMVMLSNIELFWCCGSSS